MMQEQFNSDEDERNHISPAYPGTVMAASEEEPRKNRPLKPSTFSKSSTITFFKAGICHMCRGKSKLVYQCYKNYMATSCEKKFCLDCLVLVYKENIVDTLQKCDNWKCPYLKKICRCKPCCLTRRENESVLELDPSQAVLCSLKSKQKPSNQLPAAQLEEDDMEEEIDENLRCMLKEKFRKLIDFNGQMISKFNGNLHKLNEEESRFYNKIIHSNLKVLDRLSKNMLGGGAITDD